MNEGCDILLSTEQNGMGCWLVKMQMERQLVKGASVHRGTIEGVVVVNGRPQVEQADMPLAFSFDSVEDLERFCEAAKNRSQDQH